MGRLNNPYFVTAYGLATQQGYTGTLEQWLESLQAHIHIKWSENCPTCNEDMQDTPAAWMGILADNTLDASARYTDYTWQYVKGTASAENMAPAYDSTKTYALNDVCSFGEAVFKCTTPITKAEAWNQDHWEQTSVGERVMEVSSEMATDDDVVKLTEQTLTDEQKAQVLTNIGLSDALHSGKTPVLGSSWYGTTLPENPVAGQVFFLKV